jgi:hypothetical protein
VDLFDPNTWKPVGQLISSWQAIIGGIIAFVGYITGFFRWVLKRLSWFPWRAKSKVEQKGISLTFVPNDPRCHWGGAKLNDQSGTHVQGRWDVTNSSESDVMILKARLGKHQTRFAQVSTHHPEDERNFFGKYPIRSHEMSEVLADFTFFPSIGRAPEPIISDVIFTDNFGNEHRVRTQFSYIGPDKPL